MGDNKWIECNKVVCWTRVLSHLLQYPDQQVISSEWKMKVSFTMVESFQLKCNENDFHEQKVIHKETKRTLSSKFEWGWMNCGNRWVDFTRYLKI